LGRQLQDSMRQRIDSASAMAPRPGFHPFVVGCFSIPGSPPTTGGAAVNVALWQPVIEQSKKWKPEHRASWIALHLDEGLPQEASLIVWPETALPMTEDTARDALGPLDDDLRARNATLVSGVLGDNIVDATPTDD
jgi:Apolipoprotein N-acyltransferase